MDGTDSPDRTEAALYPGIAGREVTRATRALGRALASLDDVVEAARDAGIRRQDVTALVTGGYPINEEIRLALGGMIARHYEPAAEEEGSGEQ